MPLPARLLLYVACAYLAVCVAAFFFQRRLLFLPDARRVTAPSSPRFADMEAVTLAAGDGTRLEAFWHPGQGPHTLLVLHGNAGHRGDRLGWTAAFHQRSWPVFLLDYRGYGGSAGSPTQAGLVADAVAAIDWLTERGRTSIVLFGESIGSSVAVCAAAQRDVTGLVLHAATISIADVAANVYPWMPVRWFLKDAFDLRAIAPRVRAPALLVHGDEDTLVPPAFGRALAEQLGGKVTWHEIAGAGHNDLWETGGDAYEDAVDAFLRSLP